MVTNYIRAVSAQGDCCILKVKEMIYTLEEIKASSMYLIATIMMSFFGLLYSWTGFSLVAELLNLDVLHISIL